MSIWDDVRDSLKDRLKGEINDMLKGDGDKLPDANQLPDQPMSNIEPNAGAIGRKAILDDPFFDNINQHFIYRHKTSRISNKTLKDVSLRDWLVSAILQCRADTLLRFSRPQPHDKKYEMGYRFVKRDGSEDFTEEDRQNIAMLTDFIYNCGRTDKLPPSDRMFFGEFLKLTVRDALTFGNIAVEKVRTRRGGLHRFRPLPAESVYRVNKQASRELLEREMENARKLYTIRRRGINDSSEENVVYEADIEYFKYIQMSFDNRMLAAFGDEDMIFKLFNPQNYVDSLGYCYSPLELAIINVTNHLNVENYNANFFTHGYAARGILHLKGTVTQPQLTAFRRQFYSTIGGAQHAWRTPIIAGLDDVQWIPMSGSAKEMEYINFNNHLLRAVCTQFQIDPVELGLDYLNSANGRAPMQQANNEYKIEYSRERGLLPILMYYEDMINSDILPALDKDLAAQYKFEFTGYTDETPQTSVALLQAEMTVHRSMNDLLREIRKDKLDHPIADLPLNPSFWALVEKNMTKGEIREIFLKDKGAAQRRELQYIPGDPSFMAWQQLLLTIDRQRKQDAMQDQQMQHANDENQRAQEQHDAAMEQYHSQQAHAAVAAGNPEAQGQEQQNSLKDNAKVYGAASKALHVGSTPEANPINTVGDE